MGWHVAVAETEDKKVKNIRTVVRRFNRMNRKPRSDVLFI